MVAIFPALVANAAGSIQCMHGGVFKGTASTTTKFNGDWVCTTQSGFTVITACPGIAPQVPACQLTVPAQSMATRVTIDGAVYKPVTVITPQISASNGMPSFLKKTSSSTVKVL